MEGGLCLSMTIVEIMLKEEVEAIGRVGDIERRRELNEKASGVGGIHERSSGGVGRGNDVTPLLVPIRERDAQQRGIRTKD